MTQYEYPGGGGGPYGEHHPFAPPQPAKSGLPTWVKVVLILASVFGGLTVLCCGGLIWVGASAPPSEVLSASEVPGKYHDVIADLGLLEPGERMILFCSDADWDVENAITLLTDRHLVRYARVGQTDMLAKVPLGSILEVDATLTESWMDLSQLWVRYDHPDGYEENLLIPLWPMGGGDEIFRRELISRARQAGAEVIETGDGS